MVSWKKNASDGTSLTYSEAYEMVSECMLFYNERRIHASIGYRPPKEFHELRSQGTVQTAEVRV